MYFSRYFVILAITAALSACASSQVLVGKERAPISPDDVKVYLHAPAKYEEIALLEASSRNSLAFSSQGKMNKVIERLKEDAAELGANGILLQGTGTENLGSVNNATGTASITGNSVDANAFGTSVAIIQKTGTAIAIYVPEE